MLPQTPRGTSIEVKILRVPAPVAPLGKIDCLHCGTPLEIHQPEGGLPERLLGTCEHCHSWYLWDLGPAGDWAALVLLPAARHVLKTLEDA
ncbi:MAG: hypothetical protein IRY99_20050 [Isosphaeraceae bacterium]|nr:hypothetical protein [Isosphaeraceae bacterium]